MSYSFNVRGKTKHEVTEKARAALAAQLAQMNEHRRDASAAHASIAGHIAACDEPADGYDLVVEANGSVGGSWVTDRNGASVMATCSNASHTVRVYCAPVAIPATTP